MSKKIISGITLTLFLMSVLTLGLSASSVLASLPVHNIDTGEDFAAIQEAIDDSDTLNGHTILVDSGVYCEHVVVNKSVSLVGENQVTTIIDGSISGYAIHIRTVNNVNITEFTIQHGWGCGIFVESSQDSILSRNIITLNVWDAVRLHDCIGFTISENKITTNPDWGIRIFSSSGTSIRNNTISNNGYGIDLRHSSNNVVTYNVVTSNNRGPGIHLFYSPNSILKDNNMTGNLWNLRIEGDFLLHYIQDIDTSNTVNGNPVYYLINQNYLVIQPSIFPDIGYLGIVDSTAITVRDLHLTNNGEGILFAYTSGSIIENVNVSNNLFGIHLEQSDENMIISNTISNNEFGIALFYCLNNTIHHNNFINNKRYQVYPVDLLSNVWDNGYPSGGNYWSDYDGTDADEDGIGDTPYVIDANNQDRYPLMNPWGTGTPLANFTWTPSTPKVSESVTFDASSSTPIGGEIVSYEWNFGDDSYDSGEIVSHIYTSSGTYTVTLNVTDNEGLWDTSQKQIRIVQPHGPEAEFTATPDTASIGDSIKFDASASLPGWNGTHEMPITEYRWDFGGAIKITTSSPIFYYSFISPGIYYATLTVYAPGATPETNTTSREITITSVPIGGYSLSIKRNTTANPLMPYTILVVILTSIFATIKRETHRRTKRS